MVPADLLSQSGDRQCSLPELGKELQGKTQVTPEDMQELRGTGMQGHREHAEIGCQQHEQYPVGAWLGPRPTWYDPPSPFSLGMPLSATIISELHLPRSETQQT